MSDNVEHLDGEAVDSADKIREGLKANAETNTGAEDKSGEEGTPEKQKTEDKPKPSDNEAKLLKELMKHKAAAKKAADDLAATNAKWEGLDLDAVKTLLEEKENAETSALEKKGEYSRLLEKQKEAAQKDIDAQKKRADDAEAATKALHKTIEDLTTGQAFSNSKFVADKLTLTPNKAKVLYKSHFEFEDGKMVGYDKPKGESDRTMIVDTNGNAVSFEDAIAAIIDADPDKDSLLKADIKQGAGSKPTTASKPQKQDFRDNTDKIAQGLNDFFKKK